MLRRTRPGFPPWPVMRPVGHAGSRPNEGIHRVSEAAYEVREGLRLGGQMRNRELKGSR